jgi:hypothetical protein
VSYKLVGFWQESIDAEFESLDEAVEAANELALTKANGSWNIHGHGVQLSVWPYKETVEV